MSERNFMWKSLIGILCITIAMIFMIGCEGEQGPAGPAGADGDDGAAGIAGSTACLDCHSTDAMTAISFQFDRSGHGSAVVTLEREGAWSGSCVRCHTGNGFAEYILTGENIGSIENEDIINCQACHNTHTTFTSDDEALRTTVAVAMIADAASTFDFGDNSNLCANCHQSRRAEPNIDVPGTEFSITSTHYGPHHGAQANVLNGTGFAEIAGTATYPTTSTHLGAGATCVACHMAEFDDGEGGHTFTPSVAKCDGCHTTTDFNYGNVRTEVGDKLDELRDLLIAKGVIEYVAADEAYEPIVLDPVVPIAMEYAQAFFNWVGLSEDRSLGAHNPKYVNALLDNSIEALQ